MGKIWNSLLGRRYVVNLRSKEIHDMDNEKTNCHLSILANKEYISEDEYKDYLNDGYNGCRWCNKKDDNG